MDDKNKYYPLSGSDQLRTKLGGMTVNERLWETEQIDNFERASKAKDSEAVRKILESVFVDEDSIRVVLNSL